MDLFGLIEAGDGDEIRELLRKEPGLAAGRNQAGLSPVLFARYRHRPELVEAVLEAGPELDVFDAAALGRLDRLAELLDADPALVSAWAGDGFHPLALAAFFGQPAAVRLLLDRGADVTAVSRNDESLQATHAATAGRNPEAVEMLLAAGADPNARQQGGFTPLMAARQNGDDRIVAALVAAGATD